MAWIALQVRRIVWVGKDLVFCLRALISTASYARSADQHVAIGLLEGQVWALAGRANSYRIRLVNETPGPLQVDLQLCGEAAGARHLELRCYPTLPRRGVSELFLVTDWESRFELAHEPPSTDGLGFLFGVASAGVCRLVARLQCTDRLLDEAAIIQPLAT